MGNAPVFFVACDDFGVEDRDEPVFVEGPLGIARIDDEAA